jgi:hypothetical protein
MPDRGPSSPPDFADGPGADIAAGTVDAGQPIELSPEPFSLTETPTASPDEPPTPKSTIRRLALTGLLVVAIAGAAVLGYASWQVLTQKDATLTTPAQLGGLRRDDSQDGKDTADYLRTALVAEIDLEKPVGAVYTDGTDHDVLFFGGTGLIWSPGKDLDAAFAMISDDQGAVTNLHDVPAGKLGGTMQCGTTKTDDGAIPVCGWADHGALAVAMFPNRTEPESAELLLNLRDAAQSRH